MKRSVPHRVVIISQTAAALVFICLTPLYATTTLAGILYGLIHGLGLANSLTWVDWVIVSPIIYVTWLNSFLIACAIDIQAWRLLFGFRKHRRITTANGIRDWFQFHLMLVSYMRERIVWHLPLTQSYLGVEGLRLLVLWAGAPKVRLGRGSFLFGLLYDPDLTEVGEDAILGSDSTVTAHAMTVNRDGSRVFVTADVTIGARALIGGGARIDLGVRIGSDAIVEPMSYVSPYTHICDGEVWGGNPAQFIRRRFEQPEHISAGVSLSRREDSPAETISPSSDSTDEAELRQLVATALDLSLDEIHADLSANQCAAWDSLGQMAIAAGLHDRYGIMLGANEIFHLKSMADLRRAIMADAARVGHQTSRAADSSARCVDHGLEALKLVSEAELPRDPELLPLLDHQQVTRYLAAYDAGGVATSGIKCESVSVVIAATFVAEPVANSLKLWARAFGIPVDVRFAGFNQVQQCLMSPDSALHQNITGINVVLTRPEDFVSEAAGSTEAAESLLAAISIFSKNLPGTLVVGTLPPVVSTFCAADRLDVESLRATWRNRLSQIAGVRMLDFSEVIEQIGIGLAGRSDLEVVARAPYTPRVYQELGIEIARMVRQERIAPAKVIALDADGVLWGGVLGEDGMMGIHLSGDHPGRSFQLFQRQLRSLKDRGCLLVLVSRNEAQDVWRVFDEHPEMVLRRTDIAAARINWQPKSHNLRELAAELNVGLDSFVFIDDDPANHAEVAMNAPGVTVVPMPTDPVLYCQTLSRLWRFDSPHLTAEDQNRAQMVQAEQERKQLHDATADLGSYLKSLRLRVEMRAAKEAELPRVSQLTQKTNQFNTSLKRRSLPEIQSLAKTHAIYVVEASDRFGDYGLIGVAMLVRSSECPKYFVLDTLLISCRALGRGIEDAVLHGLGSVIANDGGQRLVIPCVDGPRNQPCRDFLKRAAMSTRTTGEFEWQTDAELALPTHIEWLGPTLLAERRVA